MKNKLIMMNGNAIRKLLAAIADFKINPKKIIAPTQIIIIIL